MDEKTLSLVESFVANKKSVLIFADEVKKIHQHGGSAPRVLISTCNFLYICTEKVKEKHCYAWYDIKEMKIEGKTISFAFKDNQILKFISVIAEDLYQKFAFHLRKILSDDEYEPLNINIHKKMPKTTGASVVWRLQYFLHQSKNKITIGDFIPFITCVVKSWYFFDMNLLPINPYHYYAVLQALKLRYNVKTLSVTKLKEFDVLGILAQHLDLRSIEHLQLKDFDTDDESFIKFLDVIKNSKNCLLCCLSFVGCKFSKKTYSLLLDAMGERHINSLALDECIRKDDMQKLFVNENYKKLDFLRINGSPLFNTSILLHKIENLEALSIAFCGKDIGEVFEFMSNNELKNLKALDISGNYGIGLKGKGFKLSPHLMKVKADKVEWNGEDLVEFLELIVNSQTLSTLSIADMKMDIEGYKALGKFFTGKRFTNLRTLCWDKNKVSQEFFNVLRRSETIDQLSLSYSIDDNSMPFLVNNLIKNNKRIKTLIIRGSDTKQIKKFTNFCKALETCDDFRFLDITGHLIDSKTANSIISSLSRCPKFEGCAIDSTRIENCQQWNLAISQLLPLNRPIFISLPFYDLARLSDDPQKLALRETIRKLAGQVLPPNWPFDPFINSFYYRLPIYFPPYIAPIEAPEEENELIDTGDGKFNEHSLPSIIRKKDEHVLEPESEILPFEKVVSEVVPIDNKKGAAAKPSTAAVADVSEDHSFVNDDSAFQNEQSMSMIDDLCASSIQKPTKTRKTTTKKRPTKSSRITLSSQKETKQKTKDTRHLKKPDWGFPLNYVPEIDNTDLIEETAMEFSLVNIIKELKSS